MSCEQHLLNTFILPSRISWIILTTANDGIGALSHSLTNSLSNTLPLSLSSSVSLSLYHYLTNSHSLPLSHLPLNLSLSLSVSFTHFLLLSPSLTNSLSRPSLSFTLWLVNSFLSVSLPVSFPHGGPEASRQHSSSDFPKAGHKIQLLTANSWIWGMHYKRT